MGRKGKPKVSPIEGVPQEKIKRRSVNVTKKGKKHADFHADTARFVSDTAKQRLVEMPAYEAPPENIYEKLSVRDKILLHMNGKTITLALTGLLLISTFFTFVEMFNVTLGQTITRIEYAIAAIFGTETFIRLCLMGPRRYFKDFLCVCDLTVSILDIVTIIVLPKVLENDSDLDNLVLLRVIRVSRLSKITRISRLVKEVDNLEHSHRGNEVVFDEFGHIFNYNPATLFSLGWIYNLAGSVVIMPEIWVQALMLVIFTTLLAALTCPIMCDPETNAYDSDFAQGGDCANCVNSVSADFGLMFLGLAAFLLGIFASLLFDRWWSLRKDIQRLFSEVMDTAMMTFSFIRGTDSVSNAVRRDVVRWSKLSIFLLEKQIDGKHNYREAVLQGMLTEREWDKLVKEEFKDHFIIPQQWAMDALCMAKDSGLVNEYGGTFDSLIMTFPAQRGLCSDILMFMSTPIPYIFAHLMTVICKVNLVFMSASCGTFVGQAIEQEQYLSVCMGYFIVIVGTMLVEGLLRLHVVLSDPFGDDACDFPWESMMEDMDRKVNTLVRQIGNCEHPAHNEIHHLMTLEGNQVPEVDNQAGSSSPTPNDLVEGWTDPALAQTDVSKVETFMPAGSP